MRTILFTNARDEKNILEWVVHHWKFSFDTIYIFDHKSIVPIESVVKNVPNVEVQRCDGDSDKGDFIRHAVAQSANGGYDWMLYLDADEFLVLNHDDHIIHFLGRYAGFDQIGVNWLLFGSNYREERLKEGETILGAYTRSDYNLDQHIKTFLHLRNGPHTRAFNPHCYDLDFMGHSVGTNHEKLHPETPWWFKHSQHWTQVNAFIAHYVYQSYEEYLQRKIVLPRDDLVGAFRTPDTRERIHSLYNQDDNPYLRDKYDAKNRELIERFRVKPLAEHAE
jgi:hypothetical protein